jgi:hypothetical protein
VKTIKTGRFFEKQKIKESEPINSQDSIFSKNQNQPMLRIQYFQRTGTSRFFEIPFFLLPRISASLKNQRTTQHW